MQFREYYAKSERWVLMFISTENKDFYPTPKALIEKMLNKIRDKKITTILEPSAGKGDICDYILESKIMVSIDTIEIDNSLCSILKNKNYKVIHNDFLSFKTLKKYDLIIANFPFSEGDKHLDKALNILEIHGGQLVCLVNAETIKNPFSNVRTMLISRLNKYNAEIEFLENEFINAERKTDVEVALIYVAVPRPKRTSFIFENLKKAEKYKNRFPNETEVVETDYIKAAVSRYQFECNAGINLIYEYNAIKPYIQRNIDSSYNSPILELKLDVNSYSGLINGYIEKVRIKYWKALFQNPKFVGKLTSNLQKELYSKVESLIDYEFSEFNIASIEKDIRAKLFDGVEQSIMKLFDKLSGDHAWYPETKNNIHYFNGWASNKAHKVNKKVIIPIRGMFSTNSWDKGCFNKNEVFDVLQDIEKSLNYLDGNTTADVDMSCLLTKAKESNNFKKITLKYFDITLYKKGTCHIEFTNMDLLDKFNIYASLNRKWLPPSYGKKAYKDMNNEEKDVIDGFQGENNYNKVFANRDFYIAKTENLLMITG